MNSQFYMKLTSFKLKHIKCNCHFLLICTFMTVAVESHQQKGAIKFKSLKKQPFRGVLTSEKIF